MMNDKFKHKYVSFIVSLNIMKHCLKQIETSCSRNRHMLQQQAFGQPVAES